jgi:CHAT domain-containing protein
MDQQSQEAYINLINALLNCTSGESAQIFNNYSDFIDPGLVQMMQQKAAMLAQEGDDHAAHRLQSVAAQVAEAIQEFQKFLGEVLQATSDTNGDKQVVYRLLEANLDKLNMPLAQAQLLDTFVKANVANVEPQVAQVMAAHIFKFSELIRTFPLGNRANSIEIAIAGYEIVLTVFTRDRFPEDWAKIQINLGVTYSDRIRGERAENLEQAIACYHAALEEFPRSDFPKEWAMGQDNLGCAYLHRIRGEKADNLEQAITWFHQALEVNTRTNFPEEWARTQHNLGGAYNYRIRGERAENLEQAIACYRAALEVSTRSGLREEWAKIQNDLGLALSNRICEERADNLEAAIECYNAALEVRTHSEFPEKWAMTQNNLGSTYRDRIRGERAENLELSIACHCAALEVYTPTSFPENWAQTQTHLGNAYRERIRGERAENLELSIACFRAALKEYTPSRFAEQWARTQHNLGTTYRYRIRGERAENLELAIACFRAALQVRTPYSFPEQWALTQNNLGSTYRERIRGNRAENIEEAIKCYNESLKIRTRTSFPEQWAVTQNNLGNAYRDRIQGNKVDNLETAIGYYRAALEEYTRDRFPTDWANTQYNLGSTYLDRIRGEKADNLEAAIECYNAALEEYTRSRFPENWARTQNGLGGAYYYRIRGEKADNLEAAIKCYNAALEEYSLYRFPQDHPITSFNLGLAYTDAQRFQEAYNTFQSSINTVELLREEIISGDEIKQKLAEEWNKCYQYMVEVCLSVSEPIIAIEYAERSKTRNLVELILTRDRHTIFPAEVVVQLDRLRDEIASGQYELQNATAEDPTALARHLQQLRQQRNELQDRYLPIGSGFQFEPFRSTLSDRTAIVEFYIATDKLLVFIITKHTQQPIVFSPDLINLNKLANWANSYLKAYSYKKSHWHRRLTTRLHLLAKILHIDEIIKQIPTECDKLILIPHRYLHFLPFHALPLVQDSSLFDRFPEGVSYAPSCQLLQLAQTRQRPEFTHLFAVQNPTGDLSYTDIEVETIQSYFNSSNLLKQKIATKEAIDKTSLTAVHCAHFSCHGYFNGSEPRKSALILANAELNSVPTQPDTENYLSLENGGVLDLNKCLTLDSVFTLNLEQCRLVTLSACETGLIDFRNTSDEYIGLPSGFLYAGASSVVSSLWTVNDLSTAFLMIRFYQNLQKGLTVGLALNQAQLWLRDITKAELQAWITAISLPLDPTMRQNLNKRLHKLKDEQKPFQYPFHWAAFCTIGQ